jgi:antitoxin component YwqK of YwqJK toxin-antitoxin module
MPSKSPFWLIIIALTGAYGVACGQGFTRKTYHDPEKKKIKEVYLVKDTIRNVAHGRYTSYFVNGGVESKGQFENNETTGVWEFYFETGKLKMRGILFKSANYGMWEYFYEGSGQKSMEGIINGKNREGEWKSYYENGHVKEVGGYKENRHIGLWKSYFEDGALKGEIVYTDDSGYYTEYYHSGKPQSEGTRAGTRNTGHWKFYREDGSLESEGDYVNGKKHGPWKRYFSNSVVAAKGNYANDEPVGPWEYFYESGGLQSSGEYVAGKKDGYWKTLNSNGTLKSEVAFTKGSGEYREYHPNGSLKVKGPIRDGKRQGKWEFFLSDGTREGECDYNYDKGTFYGYYPTGELQTKGTLEGELKTGTWEIYEKGGKLSGYYKPFYDERKLGKEIVALATTSSARKGRNKSQGFPYLREKGNEFHGVIMSTNPVWTAVGRIPLGVEFYIEERLGHEFEFLGIRDPFFTADSEITPGKLFQRGYSISIKQKFYNGMKVGMWYFGHELRFTNLGHFVNDPTNRFTFNAVEQRIEWGPILGYRIMRRSNASGFTIDTFASFDIGYRGFDIDPMFASYFEPLDRDKFSRTLHIGLNFGNVFSYR